MKRAVLILAMLYLIMLVGVWTCIYFDRGEWWLVTLFLFSPRWAIALPLLILVPITLFWCFRLTPIYVLHGVIILFPIMGYRLPLGGKVGSESSPQLRLISCNMGEGADQIDRIVALVKAQHVHVLMMQECYGTVAKQVFTALEWSYQQQGNLVVGSSLPLENSRIIARQPARKFNVLVALACDLQLPSGPPAAPGELDAASDRIEIICLHLPTFRTGFEQARGFKPGAGATIEALGAQYREIVEQILQETDQHELPLVIAGDFNVPIESAYYRDYWSDYQNALSIAGWGLLHTKFTRFHGIRIDHVLADRHWRIRSASVGPDLGGDHRPVMVDLTLIK